tara:strand:+ start:1286 stop:2212 length:927 start_codon:yes stop_codon:yes gene_type:complete
MKIIYGIKELEISSVSSSLTIGNFDGVHKGHKDLIDKVKIHAHDNNYLSTIITFEPLPEEYFDIPKFRKIMRLEDKLKIFKAYDVDQVLCINFNKDFSEMTADDFIEDILINKLDTKYLIIGSDFRFGHKRLGTFDLLKSYEEKRNIKVENINLMKDDNQKISSTRIRNALLDGNIELANKLIGRTYMISGKVTKGEQRGRLLGYPTANIDIYNSYPINGIFLVKIMLNNGDNHFGLASLGNKPTFSGQLNVLEVYIFDFNKDIYGTNIEISFLQKIRDQVKFQNQEELVKQMDNDYAVALKLLESFK